MKSIKPILLAVALCAGFLVGCAGLSRSTYNTEKLAADAVDGAVHGYNLYLSTATNQPGVDPSKLIEQRDKVYADVRQFARIEQTVTTARLAYQSNSADTNKTTLSLIVGTLSDASGAIVAEVKQFIGGK